MNLILKAIQNDHLETVKLLVEKIPDLNLCFQRKNYLINTSLNKDDQDYTIIGFELLQPILYGICKFLLSFFIVEFM